MTMLKLLIIGECTAEPYIDASLTYISEVDPMWESDLLTLVLNPEAVVFANPIASMVCAADCVAVTAGKDNLAAYFCAGCDGNLYPLTGHIYANDDAVRTSSLITQRLLTKLHRQGMLMRTMGADAMCEKRGNTLHHVPSIGFQCFSLLLRRRDRIAVIVLVIRYTTGQPLKVGAKK